MKGCWRSLLLFCLSGISCLALFGTEVPVQNGGFEDDADGVPLYWSIDGYRQGPDYSKYYISEEDPHSGKKNVVLENLQRNDSRLVQVIPVKPDTVYMLSCFIRVKTDFPDLTGASISVHEENFYEQSEDFTDTEGLWKYVEFYVRTGKEKSLLTAWLRLGGFSNDVTGKAEFDDFKVTEITDPGGAYVVNLPGVSLATSLTETQWAWLKLLAGFIVILLAAGTALLIVLLIIKPRLKQRENRLLLEDTTAAEALWEKKGTGVKYTRLDLILCAILTLVYAITAYTHLGTLTAPQTHWQPVSVGEGFHADLGSVQNVRRIYYFQGLPINGNGKLNISYSDDAKVWEDLEPVDMSGIFFWDFKAVNFEARYIRVTALTLNLQLKELIFFGNDRDHPLKIEKIYSYEQDYTSGDTINNAFDEQDTVAYRPSIMNGMTPQFDEMYHARTAYEHLTGVYPYETSHPPLGKLIMALGIILFKMVPFGWRVMGTTMGIIMVTIMYLFGKWLFKKSEYAFFCALLIACDFMHFTQTRIATIDSYGVLFIICMYFFMYQYYSMDFYKVEFKKTLLPLFFCGISWGLGVASKWISLNAAFGLALLFFITLGRRLVDYFNYQTRLKSKKWNKTAEEAQQILLFQQRFPRELLLTLGWCVLTFIIIPGIIYFISYIPIFLVQKPVNVLKSWWEMQTSMFRYHTMEDSSTVAFTSRWYLWPLIWRPYWYYMGQHLPSNQAESLVAMGNPAVWWVGSLATLVLIINSLISCLLRFKKAFTKTAAGLRFRFHTYQAGITAKAKLRFFILIAFAAQYLIWVISPRRLTYIYHFFASVPFIIFSTVYLIKEFIEKLQSKGKKVILTSYFVVYLYLALAVLLFIMFYPVLSATAVDKSYFRFLKWLPEWPLYY